MGPGGTLFIFSLLFSICYLCIFVAVCIPWFYFAGGKDMRFNRWVVIACGAFFFMLGIPVLSRIFSGPTNIRSAICEGILGLAAGLVTFAISTHKAKPYGNY